MNATASLTRHAEERLTYRLNGIVTAAEVLTAAAACKAQGRTYATVKRIAYTEIADPSVKPDGIARGDSIVAAVERRGSSAVVVTVMLRKSWSKSATYDNRSH